MVEALEVGLRVDPVEAVDVTLDDDAATTVGLRRAVRPQVTDPTLHEGERLQKVLAAAGFGSRRVCEDLIAEGRVTVNGEVAVLGRRVDPDADHVEVDGVARRRLRPGLVLLPAEQAAGRRHAPPTTPRVGRPWSSWCRPSPACFPVGRLDLDTEGLLLLTNDGDLTHRLTHPSLRRREGVPGRTSRRPRPVAGALRRLRDGVELDDGATAPARVVARSRPTLVRLVIHEGRNRQVRRMCEAVGHPVTRLVRTRIGPVADHTLPPGRVAPPAPGRGPGARGGGRQGRIRAAGEVAAAEATRPATASEPDGDDQ